MVKQCSKCKLTKETINFGVSKKNSDGLYTYCKSCKSDEDKKYRQKLKELGVYKERKRQEYLKHYDKRRQAMLDYNKNRRDYKKEYQTTLKLRKKNPLAKLRNVVRNRLLVGLKANGFKTNLKSVQIFGAEWDIIKKHIENQFTEGMNWDNHGKNKDNWHFDHIIPLSSAKTDEDFLKLCHYTNMQPMWSEENLKKGTKILFYLQKK